MTPIHQITLFCFHDENRPLILTLHKIQKICIRFISSFIQIEGGRCEDLNLQMTYTGYVLNEPSLPQQTLFGKMSLFFHLPLGPRYASVLTNPFHLIECWRRESQKGTRGPTYVPCPALPLSQTPSIP